MRRFLFIFIALQGFDSHAEDGSATAAKSGSDRENLEKFPNYFKYLDFVVQSPSEVSPISSAYGKNLATLNINRALAAIVHRLEIPYPDKNNNPQKKGFFNALEEIAKAQDPEVKLYVFGGVVRSLLGYIYKKLHNAHLKEEERLKRALTEDELIHLIKRTFVFIIHGFSQKNYQDYLNKKISDVNKIFKNDFPSFSVLGVGSDLDILFKSNKPNFDKKPLEEFIQKARQAIDVKTGGEEEDFINSFLPKADVLPYQEQLDRTKSEGGSTLDWIAFPINGEEIAVESKDVLKDFITGIYRYKKGKTTSHRQTVRGLRPLLEIPFLRLDRESQNLLNEEVSKLTVVDQKDVDKLFRNARYGAADNLLTKGESLLAKSVDTSPIKVPVFLRKVSIETRKVKDRSLDDLLLKRENFEKEYTKDGVLLHGTSSLNNLLYIVRNGLFVSQESQGGSVYGPGVYMTSDVNTAQGYATDNGMILEFPLNPSLNLRILNYENVKNEEKILKLTGGVDLNAPGNATIREAIFNKLARDYDIDIIVNTHVLIENADAVQAPKKAIDFIKTILIDASRKLDAETISLENLNKIYDILYGDTHKALLALLAPGELEKLERLKEKLYKKLENLLNKGLLEGSIFVFQQNITQFKALAAPILDGALSKIFPDQPITIEQFIHFMETGEGIEKNSITTMLKRDNKWMALGIVAYILKQEETLSHVDKLNTLMDYNNVYSVFSSYPTQLGPLVIQRLLASDTPTSFLTKVTKFQMVGHKETTALALILGQSSLKEIEQLLDLCLYAFSNNTIAAHKEYYVESFIKLGDRAKKTLNSVRNFLQFIGADRDSYATELLRCINNEPDAFNLEEFIDKIKPYLEGLYYHKIAIFKVLLLHNDQLDMILKLIDETFRESKDDLGEFCAYLNKTKQEDKLKTYIERVQPYIIEQPQKGFYFTSLLDALLKFKTKPNIDFILDLFKQENSNNLSVSLVLEALDKFENPKIALEKVKKLIEIIPLKEHLTYTIIKFLKLSTIENLDQAMDKLKNHLEVLKKNDLEKYQAFMGQDATKIMIH